MDSKFTIQYGEFVVAEYLSKIEGISIFVPASPQEKGIDLIAYKAKSKNRIQTVQVKMSRSYNTDKKFQNRLWFNRFEFVNNT